MKVARAVRVTYMGRFFLEVQARNPGRARRAGSRRRWLRPRTRSPSSRCARRDLVTALNDVRSGGHYEFLSEGVHVWTDSNTSQDKVALYFPVTDAFPTTGNVEWFGTTPAPGAQLVFDVDNITGNGNDYNVLVGESVYGANWWLTNGSSAAAKAADPSGAENGGNGSEWFGTLAQWKSRAAQRQALRRRVLARQRHQGRGRGSRRQPRRHVLRLHRHPGRSSPRTSPAP